LKDLKKVAFPNLNSEFLIEIEVNNILSFKYFELNNLNLIFQVEIESLTMIFDF